MPLRMSPAPASALRSVLAALGSAVTEEIPGDPRPDTPLPIHEISRIGQRSGPPSTQLTGWRFLLHDGGGGRPRTVVGAAEAVRTPSGWSFARLHSGPYVSSTAHALEQATALPLPYQPRLLSIPELYMLTLWLHGDADAEPETGVPAASDLLVPLAPAPPGIAAHQTQRVDALLPRLTHRLTASPLLGDTAVV
ncbi:hypothetical protein [Streptomyces oceani]|uniref:Uncharacterized protein n=1 Tax=Streptomyces oceani TaxID=1075402 RepID=A0A1E7JMQ3_9ACTN|nr:hypothetical protein [Streptomyces oceani]OEU89524.1 hypothetical protein AN216_25525 [Streptomyces oceani]